ncbi:DUF4931 domain-containing protein [Enterococcus malodoratus]|uniref:DUF4931 domain-containing protein n=1 Tax=Enterococcus malodoratus TaxID=71451 RepID=UPI0039AEF35B
MENKNEERALVFLPQAANGKPQHMGAEKNGCPFCDYAEEENILRREKEMLWIRNKYQTLQDTFQTIIIESNDHNKDISTYTTAENRKLFNFAFECWLETKKDPQFESVLFYKNHGPLSGGSLKHPHMQVVGLKKLDGEAQVHADNFTGISVLSQDNVEINFSTMPVMGFLEINIIVDVKEPTAINSLADYVQKTVGYVLKDYHHGRCDSYNLFFFEEAGKYIVKLTPRFIVSPYYVGYKIAQNFSEEHLLALREEFRESLLDE